MPLEIQCGRFHDWFMDMLSTLAVICLLHSGLPINQFRKDSQPLCTYALIPNWATVKTRIFRNGYEYPVIQFKSGVRYRDVRDWALSYNLRVTTNPGNQFPAFQYFKRTFFQGLPMEGAMTVYPKGEYDGLTGYYKGYLPKGVEFPVEYGILKLPLVKVNRKPVSHSDHSIPEVLQDRISKLIPPNATVVGTNINHNYCLVLISFKELQSEDSIFSWMHRENIQIGSFVNSRKYSVADLEKDETLLDDSLGAIKWVHLNYDPGEPKKICALILGIPADETARKSQLKDYKFLAQVNRKLRSPLLVGPEITLEGLSCLECVHRGKERLRVYVANKSVLVSDVVSRLTDLHVDCALSAMWPKGMQVSHLLQKTVSPYHPESWGWADIYSDDGIHLKGLTLGCPQPARGNTAHSKKAG